MKRSCPDVPIYDENFLLKAYEKSRRKLTRPIMWPLPVTNSESITDMLKKRTIFVWFALKEILSIFMLPIDIGTMLMEFYCSYSCNLCSTSIRIDSNSSLGACLLCYKHHNGDYGLVCHQCNIFFIEQCMFCSYTECADHCQPSHCLSCDTFLCPRCNNHEKRDLCSTCYRYEFF